MRASDFDFELPEAAIARHPASRRDQSRLLVLHRDHGTVAHHRFSELPQLLEPADLLVVNDTKVLKGRLQTRKEGTGGRVSLLLVAPDGDAEGRVWTAMATSSKSLRAGQRLTYADGQPPIEVLDPPSEGFLRVRLPDEASVLTDRFGEVPLPPYLGRPPVDSDEERYQTIFARDDAQGSVAAPTAGLHFTPEVLAAARDRGIGRVSVTLDVGPGTFMPLRTDDLDAHVMHRERFELSAASADRIRATKSGQGRVVAVGTTSTRVLEACGPALTPGPGSTDLFIRPGYRFEVVDTLLTNFHLPKSTLLMLVCAFAGRDFVLAAYREAVEREYRFYSYGDAMLIL